jgi:hypothetical protein
MVGIFLRMLPTARLLATTTVAFGLLAGSALAAGPVIVAGNPTCSDIDPSWSEVKYDGGQAGAHNVSDGTVSATITIDAGSMTASFTATPGVDGAIVKAGDQANVYTYDPDATSGTLDTGSKSQISHISLCYGPDAPPTTAGDPDPDPTPDSQPQPQPQAQAPAPQQHVLGEVTSSPVKPAVVVAGRSAIHGPSSCVSKAFSVRITGRKIAKVTFRIDGRTVKSQGRKLRVNPGRYGSGLHRVEARVRYTAASATRPRTHRFVFQKCAQQAVQPNFAG